MESIEEAYITLPKGFKANGVVAGLKSNAANVNPDVEKSLVLDVALVESDTPATVAGVYTSNLVKGHSLVRSIKKIDQGGKMLRGLQYVDGTLYNLQGYGYYYGE